MLSAFAALIGRTELPVIRSTTRSRDGTAILFLALLPVLIFSSGSCKGAAHENTDDRIEKAQRFLLEGKEAEAQEVYAQLLRTDPCSEKVLSLLGERSFSQASYDLAAEHFSRLAICSPRSVYAWRMKGRAFMGIPDYSEAAKAFHEANALEPDRQYLELEGRSLLHDDRPVESKRIFLDLLTRNPKDHRALFFLGYIEQKGGRQNEARAFYERAIALHPPLVEAYQNLAAILVNEGRYKEAGELIERTLSVVPLSAPFDPKVRYNLGFCYWKAGDDERAVLHFRKYLELDPEGRHAEQVRTLLPEIEGRLWDRYGQGPWGQGVGGCGERVASRIPGAGAASSLHLLFPGEPGG